MLSSDWGRVLPAAQSPWAIDGAYCRAFTRHGALCCVGASGPSSCAPWHPRRYPGALRSGQDGFPSPTHLLAALHGAHPARAALLAGCRAMPVPVAPPVPLAQRVRVAELVQVAPPVRDAQSVRAAPVAHCRAFPGGNRIAYRLARVARPARTARPAPAVQCCAARGGDRIAHHLARVASRALAARPPRVASWRAFPRQGAHRAGGHRIAPRGVPQGVPRASPRAGWQGARPCARPNGGSRLAWPDCPGPALRPARRSAAAPRRCDRPCPYGVPVRDATHRVPDLRSPRGSLLRYGCSSNC